MPEEQSVRAGDGAADPHGCGNPLRSGIPFLILHLHLKRLIYSTHQLKVHWSAC